MLPVDADRYSAVQGTWSSSDEVAALPRAHSFVDLPEPLTTLLLEAAQQPRAAADRPRRTRTRGSGAEGAAEIVEALGVRALAAVPVAIGRRGRRLDARCSRVVPRPWEPRELAICAGLSHDLVSSLMQVRAFEQQRESMHRLEELDRAKDAFISTVSHELRTPLTSIVGYLEVMSEGGMGPLPEGVSAGLSRSSSATRSGCATWSRTCSPSRRTTRRRCPARPAAGRTSPGSSASASRPHAAATDKRSSCAWSRRPGCRRCWPTAAQIERVVLNLLGNAMKFSHAGGTGRRSGWRADDETSC